MLTPKTLMAFRATALIALVIASVVPPAWGRWAMHLESQVVVAVVVLAVLILVDPIFGFLMALSYLVIVYRHTSVVFQKGMRGGGIERMMDAPANGPEPLPLAHPRPLRASEIAPDLQGLLDRAQDSDQGAAASNDPWAAVPPPRDLYKGVTHGPFGEEVISAQGPGGGLAGTDRDFVPELLHTAMPWEPVR